LNQVGGRVITLTNGELLINKSLTIDPQGFVVTINGNNVPGNGVLVIASGATVTLTALIITGGTNSGIRNSGNLTVTNSIIKGNEGAGANGVNGGGGIQNTNGNLGLGYSTVTNNIGRGIGSAAGGIKIDGGSVKIYNSTIDNNRSANSFDGGGILCGSGALTIVNSTISSNLQDNDGGAGGILNYCTLTLVHATIFGNSTKIAGTGGVGGVDTTGNLTSISNTIIAGNTGSNKQDVSGTFTSNGYNLIGNTTGSSGWTTTDLLNVNARLAPLDNYGWFTRTHALLPDSPAIDAGELAVNPDSGSPIRIDQRTFPRPGDSSGKVDIGAYEVNKVGTSNDPKAISGQVLTQSGKAVGRALITLVNPATGETRYGFTNPFGYYHFTNVPVNVNYNVIIQRKKLQFAARTVFVVVERSDLNFISSN
ncbi:MAG: carboxypeptidase-like regulatory domain-containing protein, partial [Acidobacteriota bacterium]|nr:carboxypeptidase-like regulatory domain-containing protein [Acidobacteriota bacterium]